jgi:GNAT superfamily N-acetyltransferase
METESATAIRPALPAEARALSELALRSKAHWGYPPNFLEACRLALTLTAAYIEQHQVFALEHDGVLAGFYALCESEKGGRELDYLYLEPAEIGHGYGKLLWQHALATARALCWPDFNIAADPHAEQFYLTMGAKRIGEIESEAEKGRMLPLLKHTV